MDQNLKLKVIEQVVEILGKTAAGDTKNVWTRWSDGSITHRMESQYPGEGVLIGHEIKADGIDLETFYKLLAEKKERENPKTELSLK